MLWGSIAGAFLAVPASMRVAAAHGFGERYNLPLPLSFWLAGAAAAVAITFFAMGIFARGRSFARVYPRVNLLGSRTGRLLSARPLRGGLQLISVALLVLVVATGFAGDQTPTRNLAPTWIWVIWWVGFAYLSALVGNLWAIVNPWAVLFECAEALARRFGARGLSLGVPYPQSLGLWPAIVLFAAFAWAELVYLGRPIPAQLALMTVVFSVIAWTGMYVFGREAWLRYGDPFAVAFGVFSRFAPTEGWSLRPFAAGLLKTTDVSASTVVFVLLLLATVTFDGFMATPAWARIEGALYPVLSPRVADPETIIGTFGLIAFPLTFVCTYWLFACAMAYLGGELGVGRVAKIFVLSLVPIAIAYHLAHYFTYLLIQGQLVIRLASDPFGYGWNLFGTARYRPDVGIVGARTVWYVSVIAIVLGHVIAVSLSHLLALREYSRGQSALRSQFPMLVLMVGYTLLSLWIIAQPIVESK